MAFSLKVYNIFTVKKFYFHSISGEQVIARNFMFTTAASFLKINSVFVLLFLKKDYLKCFSKKNYVNNISAENTAEPKLIPFV